MRTAVVATVGIGLMLACAAEGPPLEKATLAAHAFIEAFAAGDYRAAARHADGDVLRGVEVQRRAREEERAAHPAEVALLEKTMRERPPRVVTRPPRRFEDHVELRAIVTTEGPRGTERSRYGLSLVWRQTQWLVYRWERL